MMSSFRFTSCAVGLALLALCAPGVRAQQQDQNQQPQQTQDQSAPPIPAYRSPLASAADNGDADNPNLDPQKIIPDDHALAGAENLGLGIPTLTHNYWQPHVDLVSTIDSNPTVAPGQTGWSGSTSFLAGLDLRRTSGNSDLTMTYLGGGTLSNTGNASSGIIQGLDFKDKISFRRVSVSFIDQLSYVPGTSFGFAGLGTIQLPGTGTGGLGSGFTSGQSVISGSGQDVTNSFVTEVDAYVTPRSSISMVGGYSLLHYFDNGLLNYGNTNAQLGYNYQLNRTDTIAVSYQFSAFRYSNYDQSINSNTLFVSYGRRLTGRLAFQVAAGPEFAFLRTPITAGSATGTNSANTALNSVTEVSWALSTSLRYQLHRASVGLGYTRDISGGSGVLAGSLLNTLTGSLSGSLTRVTSGGLNFGFSHNSGTSLASTSAPINQTFAYWFGGGNLSRPLGRTLNLSLSYQLQYQNSNSSFCIGPTCGTSVLRNTISIGVGWHARPIAFE